MIASMIRGCLALAGFAAEAAAWAAATVVIGRMIGVGV